MDTCILLGSSNAYIHTVQHAFLLAISQNLLATPEIAHLLTQHLNGSLWDVPTWREFLSSEPQGQGYTWRDAYDQVEEVIGTLSEFIEVRFSSVCVIHSFPTWEGRLAWLTAMPCS